MKNTEFLAAIKTQNVKNITAIMQTNTLTEEMILEALLLAAKQGLLNAMCCLLQFNIAKAVVIKIHPEYGNQVIYRAVQYDHLPIVKHLLENFEAIRATVADNDNRLLMRAIDSKYPLMVEYLLTFEAVLTLIRTQATTEQRHLALQAAVAKPFPSIIHQIAQAYEKLNLTLPSLQPVQIAAYKEKLKAFQTNIDTSLPSTLPPLVINVIGHYALPLPMNDTPNNSNRIS